VFNIITAKEVWRIVKTAESKPNKWIQFEKRKTQN